jgi:hypothetical protein
MIIKYQVILIGDKNPLIDNILEVLFHHIVELGLNKESITVIDESNFYVEYKKNSPTFCLYFGNTVGDFKNLGILDALIKDAMLVLPVVTDLAKCAASIPESLKNINAFPLSSLNEVEKLVACILEGLSLLRLSRRLFISYKRDESTAVAIQLFEQLEKNGFDVFLDTHSIRPSEPFQEELWHRMADTDVVVLLNTSGFLKSNWTTEELAKANSMSIGILQLIFPDHTLERDAEISIPFQLTKSNFMEEGGLTHETIEKVIAQVESLRARSLAARRDNMITEFIYSVRKKLKVYLQSEKFMIVIDSNEKKHIVIPTVGVPQAFTYNQSEELVYQIKSREAVDIYLLYDHRNIREKWLKHLEWLDNYLPIKSIKIVEVEQWLMKI